MCDNNYVNFLIIIVIFRKIIKINEVPRKIIKNL